MSVPFPSLQNPVINGPAAKTATLGPIGATFLLDGAYTGGSVSLVEHPFIAKGLAAPMHLHTQEDEFSYIIEGEFGFKLGDEVVYGRPGDLIYKPRNVWHTFWNNSDQPARLLEVITPAGFEKFFEQLGELFATGAFTDEAFAALSQRHGFSADWDSIPGLVEEYGLVYPR